MQPVMQVIPHSIWSIAYAACHANGYSHYWVHSIRSLSCKWFEAVLGPWHMQTVMQVVPYSIGSIAYGHYYVHVRIFNICELH